MKVCTAPRRIRVLQVVGNGIVGGMETVVMRLLERLPRDRFEVLVLCPYEGAFTTRLRALGIECMAVPMPDDPPWSTVQTVAALVDSAGIDVLHAHLTNAHLLAGLVGKVTGRPVLTTLHGRQLNLVDLEVHRATGTHLCTVCRHSQLHALGVGARRARVSCIPNGVDTTVFKPAAARAATAAPASASDVIDGPPCWPVVGFVGRLSQEKGPDVFVHAAQALRQRLPNARFVLIGDGPMRDAVLQQLGRANRSARPAQRSGASRPATAAGPAGATSPATPGIFWQGLRDDMPAAYRELDMLVSTSHSEAMPLAIMEAMASALPVVATRVGGVPDLVEHGRTGWLVDPGDVGGIAHFIDVLARAPADARRMGEQGRARMVAGFDLSLSVAATARLLERLATQQQPAGARNGKQAAAVAVAPMVAAAAPATTAPAAPLISVPASVASSPVTDSPVANPPAPTPPVPKRAPLLSPKLPSMPAVGATAAMAGAGGD